MGSEAERRTEKLCRTVQTTIPSLRSFAEEIYALHGETAIDQHHLVAKVRSWKADSFQLLEWKEFEKKLNLVLKGRCATSGILPPSVLIGSDGTDRNPDSETNAKPNIEFEFEEEINPRKNKVFPAFLRAIRSLVEFETKALKAKSFLSECNTELKETKELTGKIVKHFMQLFDVQKLEDVFPMMNTVFGRLHELSNFWKTLCMEVRLDASVAPSVVLERIFQR